MLARLVIISLLAIGGLVASGPESHAFWKRSQWDACNDAPTEAERIRLNCWIFYPVGDFPAGALGFEGLYGAPPFGSRGRHKPIQGPVVRRLG